MSERALTVTALSGTGVKDCFIKNASKIKLVKVVSRKPNRQIMRVGKQLNARYIIYLYTPRLCTQELYIVPSGEMCPHCCNTTVQQHHQGFGSNYGLPNHYMVFWIKWVLVIIQIRNYILLSYLLIAMQRSCCSCVKVQKYICWNLMKIIYSRY